MVRVGVVGCGYWGSKHLRVLRTLPAVGELVAVDPDPERRAAALDAFPGLVTVGHLEEVLDKLDAVVIATPAFTHEPLGVLALDAGVSVLIEKPMATSVAGAERLNAVAELTGATLMVGHTFEYNPVVVALRGLIDRGELGEIFYIDSARLNLGLYQPDVNVVWDLAPHDLSVMNYLLRDAPSTVQGWGSRHANPQREDVAYLRLNYPGSGVSAQIHVSWLDPCKVRRITVVGSQKMAVYNDLNSDEPLRVYDKGLAPRPVGDQSHYPVSYRHGSIMSPHIEFEEPLLVEDRHFLDCVRTGSRPRTDGRNGLEVVRALEAADASLATDMAVDIADVAAVHA